MLQAVLVVPEQLSAVSFFRVERDKDAVSDFLVKWVVSVQWGLVRFQGLVKLFPQNPDEFTFVSLIDGSLFTHKACL